jgi:hypothetical protein
MPQALGGGGGGSATVAAIGGAVVACSVGAQQIQLWGARVDRIGCALSNPPPPHLPPRPRQATLPVELGGLGGDTVYVNTEDRLPTTRLVDIATTLARTVVSRAICCLLLPHPLPPPSTLTPILERPRHVLVLVPPRSRRWPARQRWDAGSCVCCHPPAVRVLICSRPAATPAPTPATPLPRQQAGPMTAAATKRAWRGWWRTCCRASTSWRRCRWTRSCWPSR